MNHFRQLGGQADGFGPAARESKPVTNPGRSCHHVAGRRFTLDIPGFLVSYYLQLFLVESMIFTSAQT
jgi:hypothetical protein